VVNITEDLIWDLQDQVQRASQMLAALCRKAGIDPAEAARLPGEGEAAKVEVVRTGPVL
jgi:hypothetical protein